jgi:hypothetical protein
MTPQPDVNQTGTPATTEQTLTNLLALNQRRATSSPGSPQLGLPALS